MTGRRITLTLAMLCMALNLFAQTRLGLHVTREELNIWRDRANKGPYKVKGDAQSNSPGDWTRIAANAALFKGSSTDSTRRIRDRFKYWTGRGCYPTGATYEPKTSAELLKDAAFYWLIKQDNSYVPKIKYEILRIVRDRQLDFSNTSRWCLFRDSNPGFAITEWLTRVMFAYDYLRIGGQFSSSEQTEITTWFRKAGVKFSNEINSYYDRRFVDRARGNYTLTNYSIRAESNTYSNKKYPLYYGGPQTGFLGQGYNNRMGTIARFVGMAGVLTNDMSLQANAKRFFFEWLRYGVYPNGEVADLSRGLYNASEPERGLLYVFCLTQAMSDMADVFARKGDFSLYNYSTEEGYYGSQSPGNPKTLLKVMQAAQNYLNGRNRRYASFSATSDSKLLINGVDPYVKPGEITFDAWFSVGNLYYRSAAITNNYLRQTSGSRSYPNNPRGTGPNHPWGGQAGIYPAILFMFGKLEGKVWPYPAASSQAVAASPAPATEAPQTRCTASGTILRELWTNVQGKTVSTIPVATSPNSRSQLSLFEAPINSGNLYGQRIRGYVCPPSTGNYTFWIASDDDGELWLSQDDNPANRRRIAYIQNAYTKPREWNKYSSQQSVSIYLQAGQRYYIEALHKEGWEGDNLAVGWQLPNGTQERPIPGNRLSPFQSASGGRIEAVESPEAELQKLAEVIAYPNPFRDIVTLEWEEVYTDAFTIHVTDALGVVHFHQEYPADPYRTKLDVSLGGANLPAGMYFLRVQSLKERKVIRLLKE